MALTQQARHAVQLVVPRTRLGWSNLAVVAAAATVTAILALVVEDLLPDAAGSHVVWSRLSALVLALVGLSLALQWRSRVHRTTGTLFHVQVLDEAMADRRADGRRQAGLHRMAVRSIIRWVDLRHRTTTDGVIDVVDVCREVANAVEMQLNADSPATGYTIAPVMLWPIAVAVGTQLPELAPGDQLRLLELPDDWDNPANEVDLDQAPRKVHVKRATVGCGDGDRTGRVGVWLAFTKASRKFRLDRLAGFGATTGYEIRLYDTAAPDDRYDPRLINRHVAGLGRALADELVAIKRAHPDRELVIVAMITKITALALGWHLSRRGCRFFHNTHLMHYDRESDSYLAMRVKESQPAHSPVEPTVGAPVA